MTRVSHVHEAAVWQGCCLFIQNTPPTTSTHKAQGASATSNWPSGIKGRIHRTLRLVLCLPSSIPARSVEYSLIRAVPTVCEESSKAPHIRRHSAHMLREEGREGLMGTLGGTDFFCRYDVMELRKILRSVGMLAMVTRNPAHTMRGTSLIETSHDRSFRTQYVGFVCENFAVVE